MIVTLDALDKDALIRILTEPKNALIKQYQRLLKMDQVSWNLQMLLWLPLLMRH